MRNAMKTPSFWITFFIYCALYFAFLVASGGNSFVAVIGAVSSIILIVIIKQFFSRKQKQ
ncbi:hypothetical protein P8815_18155 [Bacillus altitudinis]|uniref:hypothetical protein n=1 Tax=Bacillus altitudinis TaxID=293387 RepID=UPI0005868BFD|nr:hypothetical protein [Bacillus altitudinis]MEC0473664.1 hypothetical protein [Bacillus altitudinis]